MGFLLPLVILAAATVLGIPSNATAITFADGQLHVIDAANSYPFETVTVLDSSLSLPTSARLVDGGEIGTAINGAVHSVGGRSTFEIEGGTLEDSLTALDTSRVLVTGGDVNRIDLEDQSSAEIDSDVFITTANGSSHLSVTGGSHRSIEIRDDAFAIMTGGTAVQFGTDNGARARAVIDGLIISGLPANSGTGAVDVLGTSIIDMFSGSIGDGVLVGITGEGDETAQFNMFGGSITGRVWTNQNATVRIMGGSVGPELLALGSSLIEIMGSGFNSPFGEILASSGVISGILADSTPINVSFNRASTATITLACSSVGIVAPTTPSLAADQNNYCEDWTGVSQPADDLSRAGLELVDLSGANLSGALLIDADLTNADLSGADLIVADLTGAVLTGALYDALTLFPSGNTIETPPWGLDNGITPWDAGMIPVPEPSFGWMLIAGIVALAGVSIRKEVR